MISSAPEQAPTRPRRRIAGWVWATGGGTLVVACVGLYSAIGKARSDAIRSADK